MQSEGSKSGFFEHFKRHLKLDDEKPAEPPAVVPEKEVKSDEVEETMADSQIRLNFHVESEAAVNKQINMESQAAYTYSALATYFSREDVALYGFAKFFKKSAEEEKGHAEKFVKYMLKRGGTVVYEDIPKPSAESWETGLEAMLYILDMEKAIFHHLLLLHKQAFDSVDPHMENFLEDFLCEQVDCIKLIADYVTNLKRVGPGLGEYMFDKELLHHCHICKETLHHCNICKGTLHHCKETLHHCKETLHH